MEIVCHHLCRSLREGPTVGRDTHQVRVIKLKDRTGLRLV